MGVSLGDISVRDGVEPASGKSPRPRARRRRRRVNGHWAYLLPAAIFLIIFAGFPFFQLIRMSLSDVTTANLRFSWPFTGLSNFTTLLGGQSDFTGALVHTVIFVCIVVVLGVGGGLATAVAIRTPTRGGAFMLGLMVFVWALPPIVNGSVWKFMLSDNGLINTLLGALKVQPIGFLYDWHLALVSVAVINSWAIIPFNALVFRAAILAVPTEMQEAARIDGARPAQEIWHVILPVIRPTTLILTALTLIYGFRSFDFIYAMTTGGPGTSTSTLPFLSYLQAFITNNYGLGSATAVICVLFVVVIALLYARSLRKSESDT